MSEPLPPFDPEVADARARLAEMDEEIDLTRSVLAEAPRYLVPSDDIWDDDEWPADGPDEDQSWTWRDAQVVVHDLDGEPFEEPIDDPVYDGGDAEAAASRMARWGQETVMGAAMMGFGRGLEKVLRQPEPAEVIYEVDDDTDDPTRPVTLHLVPGHPERSFAFVRRWLLRRHADGAPADGTA